jgi:hypothetical protein
MEQLVTANEVLQSCVTPNGAINTERINIALAEAFIRLGVAEERVSAALLTCQAQFRAPECGQGRLQTLQTSLDALTSKISTRAVQKHSSTSKDESAMRKGVSEGWSLLGQ